MSPTDLRGASRLAVEATIGLTNLVEAMHHNITRLPGPLGKFSTEPTTGITGLVYKSIRGVTHLVGGSIDALLGQLSTMIDPAPPSSPEREAILAALNGVLGDHLAASGNPLAITMRLRYRGSALELAPQALATAIPDAKGKIMLLVHGLCMNDLQWRRNGQDQATLLAVAHGFTPIHLHYNSGLHVSSNGRAFAELVESLTRAWPVAVKELVVVAHSMGGLLTRSACRYAASSGHAWPAHLTNIFFLGTPHHGAPLERGGHWVDVILGASPYTAAFARLGKLRSAGITDLRHGNLCDEDWQGKDRFEHAPNTPHPVPLPAGVRSHAMAASVAKGAPAKRQKLPGDGLVPVASALGHHADPERHLHMPAAREWVGYDMNHMDLLDRVAVYEQITRWLA